MAVPFHRVALSGNVVVAAQGSHVHSFSAVDGSYISTWTPGSESKEEKESEEPAKEEPKTTDTPPSKRRRLDSADDKDDKDAKEEQKPKKPNKNPKAQQKGKVAALRSADLPVVSILEATADGKYVIVVMGHDKTVRVLSHGDQPGQLVQISARVVPKRPCAIAVTEDGKTLLVADKFGDVYGLPVVETEEDVKKRIEAAAEAAAAAAAAGASTETTEAPPLHLEANSFTVHTKGNLQALQNQLRMKEQQQKQQPRKDALPPPYDLLLGHVSMLTAIAVGNAGTEPHRPLILTADRDEHIRVTRGGNQTYVIETFCLGHTAFVSRLCVVPSEGPTSSSSSSSRLVSGGGDGQLVLWQYWPEGRALSHLNVVPLVEAVVGNGKAAKLAVSGLDTFVLGGVSYIVAIFERVPALFFFRLSDDTLVHQQTLPLPGQLPVDVAIITHQDQGQPRLVVAATAEEEAALPARSLLVVSKADADVDDWSVSTGRFGAVPESASQSQSNIELAALRQLLLYSLESLRKSNEGEEEEQP